MATLTNKQAREIETIIDSLERGIAFIKRDDIGIALLRNHPATTTVDYHSHDETRSACMVEKAYGSHLCGLYDGLRELKEFFERHKLQR